MASTSGWSSLLLAVAVAAAAATLPMLVSGCGRGSVVLRDNGYRRVLVAIDDEVAADARLLERIKEVFTNASDLLYQTSRCVPPVLRYNHLQAT